MPRPRPRPRPLQLVEQKNVVSNNSPRPKTPPNEEKEVLKNAMEFLKRMNREKVLAIYDNFKLREKDSALQINIQTEKVEKENLKMKQLSGDIISVPSVEIPNLDRDVVRIKSVTVEEDSKFRTPIPMFSEYFYQSSGKSRETNLEGIWLPCGDFPLKERLPNLKYHKLEDEILETIDLLLKGGDSMDDEKYLELFPQFAEEFPTWQSLIQSILKYGRFISETNAMISHKLSSVYPQVKSASGVRAEGKKVTKSKPKKKKGNLKPRGKPQPTKKRSKSKGGNKTKKKGTQTKKKKV